VAATQLRVAWNLGPAGACSNASRAVGRAAAREEAMSVYRVTEVIGTSPTSWEEAARTAISAAARTLRDLRIAEVVEQDIALSESGTIESFRTKLRLSFKYEASVGAPEWQGDKAHA
jgi:hypothetical protein